MWVAAASTYPLYRTTPSLDIHAYCHDDRSCQHSRELVFQQACMLCRCDNLDLFSCVTLQLLFAGRGTAASSASSQTDVGQLLCSVNSKGVPLLP